MSSFDNCQWLIERHAPLFMRVGEPLATAQPPNRLPSAYHPPTQTVKISRIKRLRSSGLTIGDIALRVRVSWRTAWRYCQA